MKLIKTQDGSYTIYNDKYDAYYHSLFGAKSESLYVFIKHSNLTDLLKQGKNINILEIGLGTALNLLLTIQESIKFPKSSVNYYAFEPEPIPTNIWKKFLLTYNFPEAWWIPILNKEKNYKINNININLFWEKWQENSELPEKMDIIYYDAFGPKQHPEMWNEKILINAINHLKPNGKLVTFSITGKTKRILKKHNIKFATPKGFAKKREMLVIINE